MSEIASQITSLTIVYSTVHSGADQSKHQSSASLAFVWENFPRYWPFVREIHRWPVNFPHKWPVTRKIFPLDDVIMGWRFDVPVTARWVDGITQCMNSKAALRLTSGSFNIWISSSVLVRKLFCKVSEILANNQREVYMRLPSFSSSMITSAKGLGFTRKSSSFWSCESNGRKRSLSVLPVSQENEGEDKENMVLLWDIYRFTSVEKREIANSKYHNKAWPRFLSSSDKGGV